MTTKRIGVWLDHHKASFISFEPLNEHVQTVYSNLDTNQQRFDGEEANGTRWAWAMSSNEWHKNHRAMEELDKYYDTLSKLLEEYEEILLFGPTDAKRELKNKLAAQKHFARKIIHTENSEKMTENQLLAFVRDFFSAEKTKK
jgi:hypothetical protein